eukprot:scaffold32474_cov33-Tisochrysis_lutea.AAC.2
MSVDPWAPPQQWGGKKSYRIARAGGGTLRTPSCATSHSVFPHIIVHVRHRSRHHKHKHHKKGGNDCRHMLTHSMVHLRHGHLHQ